MQFCSEGIAQKMNEPQQHGRLSEKLEIGRGGVNESGEYSSTSALIVSSKNCSFLYQTKFVVFAFSNAILAVSYMLNIYLGVAEKALWFINIPIICIVSTVNFVLPVFLEDSLNKIESLKTNVTLGNNSFLTNSNLRIILLLLTISSLSAYYDHSPLAVFLQLFYRFSFCIVIIQIWNQQTKTMNMLSTLINNDLKLNLQPINSNDALNYAENETKQLIKISSFIHKEQVELRSAVKLIKTHCTFILISTVFYFAMSFIVLSKNAANVRFVIVFSIYFCIMATKPLLMGNKFNNKIIIFEAKTNIDTKLRIEVYGFQIDKLSLRGIGVGYITNVVYLILSHENYLYTQK